MRRMATAERWMSELCVRLSLRLEQQLLQTKYKMWDQVYEVVIFAVLYSLSCVNGLGNCTLIITHKGQERNDIQCVQYFYTSTIACSTGNNNLPIMDDDENNIQSTNGFSLGVAAVRENSSGTEYILQQLHFNWNVPSSGSAVKKLKGFLLNARYLAGDPKAEFCIMFDLRNNSFQFNDSDLKFKWDSHLLNCSETSKFKFDMYSLPRSLRDLKNVESVYSDVMGAQGPIRYPAEWKTSVSYRITDNQVSATFQFSNFEFSKYTITLTPKYGSGGKLQKVDVFKTDSTELGKCTFTEVKPGVYRIRVQPMDGFRNDDVLCQCFKVEDQRQCENCRTSTTSYFNMGDVQSSSSSPAESHMTSPSPLATIDSVGGISQTTSKAAAFSTSSETTTRDSKTKRITSPRQDVGLKIGLAVGGTILGVIVVAIVILITYRKTNAKCVFCTGPNTDEDGKETVNPVIETSTPYLTKKEVLVLNVEDHPHHVECVKQLVLYLEEKCGCQVIYPPWRVPEISQSNWKTWMLKYLDRVDYVMIVNSEASFKIIKASKQDKYYNYNPLTETGHLYLDVLQQVIKESKQKGSFGEYITVSFNYTSQEYHHISDLPTKQHYKLLQEIPDLVRYIHELTPQSKIHHDLKDTLSDDGLLPVAMETLHNAMMKAGKYESSDVLWFLERFGDACYRSRPTTNRYDSGFHEQDLRTRSSSDSKNQMERSDDGRDEDDFYPPEDVFSSDCESDIIPNTRNQTDVKINIFSHPQDSVSHSHPDYDDQSFVAPDTLSSFDMQSHTPSTLLRNMNSRYEQSANNNAVNQDC